MTSEDDNKDLNYVMPEKEVPSGLVKLLKHIQTFSAFYRVMLSANGHPVVTDRLRRNAENRYRFALTRPGVVPNSSDTPLDMRLTYVSCAGIGAILWWVENNIPCTAEELAAWLGELVTASLGFSLQRPILPVKSTQSNS